MVAANEGLKISVELNREEELRSCGKVVAEKLSDLNEKMEARVEEILHKVEILVWLLHDLKSAKVHVLHTLEQKGIN